VKVCIVGAGAIGGFLGTRLALAGRTQVTALARGATLAALRSRGWRLSERGSLHTAAAVASDDAIELGRQDIVFLAVKGQALPELAPAILPLLHPETIVVPAMNGVPWWFSEVLPTLGNAPLETVDPGGVTARSIPLRQVLGCVLHVSTSCVEPGFVVHTVGHGIILGEPAGGSSERAQRVADVLSHAGFDVSCSRWVASDIWYKLWGNMTSNPLSAITGATVDRLLADECVRTFCAAAMREASDIGTRIGCAIAQTPDDRFKMARALGAFRTSMLQDAEAGRPIELDALVSAVREIGQRVGVPTPTLDAIFGLARVFGQVHGLYPVADGGRA
jgi:2-dehydropantoate 2-reductase